MLKIEERENLLKEAWIQHTGDLETGFMETLFKREPGCDKLYNRA